MKIHPQPHQQPLLLDQASSTRCTFHCFPRLPKELRQQIWKAALQRPRMIHLVLKDINLIQPPTSHVVDMRSLASNGERFWAVTDGYQTLSKLFRINGESREAALSFYRVRFPCWLRDAAGFLKSEIFYFNPEHDFLRITPEWSVRNTLFNFLHLLKTIYDPQHIGLRNLVVSGNDLRAQDLEQIKFSDPDMDQGTKESVKSILENLDEVFFYSTTRAGRQILGAHNGVPTSEIVYNRSFPIQAKLAFFDRLPQDPRRIGEDLKQVYIGMNDHRDTIRLWHRRLDQFGISAPGIKYKWYIAFEPREDEQITSYETAERFMRKEDDLWKGVEDREHPPIIQLPDYKFPIGAQSERYKNEDLELAVKPAFGFWLFPIDVLGSLDTEGGPEMPLWDFSGNWPELGVVSLPKEAETD